MKINTVSAIIALLGAILVPLVLSISLCKYWYPHVAKVNEIRYILKAEEKILGDD